jgi:hypothetical protein
MSPVSYYSLRKGRRIAYSEKEEERKNKDERRRVRKKIIKRKRVQE